uniref:DNA polymerase eta n=2 Tax=Mesocestoides corti TaxID=53468 RepID=A0A5K3EJ73_MESCO
MACTEMISLDSTNYVIASEKSNIVFDPSSIEVNAQDFTEKQPPYSFSINEIPCQMDIFDRISDGQKLKSALYLAQQIKRQILEDTSFRCSVGVAANRMLAKMACSLNKPDQITLVPLESMQHLMNFTRIRKVPGLGGKLGDDVSRRYNIECFGSLTEVPLSTLVADYGEKTGNWLYGLCRGQDHQAVSTRTLVQSIGCSKNFLGKSSLMTDEDIRHWLTLLAGELVERVAIDRGTNNRLPTSLTVHVRFGQSESHSKALSPAVLATISPLVGGSSDSPPDSDVTEKVAESAFNALRSIVGGAWTTPITNIGISAGKFRPDHISRCGNVKKLFMKQIGDKVASPGKRTSFFRQFIEPSEVKAENKRSEDDSADNFSLINAPLQSISSSPSLKPSGRGNTFFQRHEADADTILCEECGSRVLVHLMPEHSDFHFARKIQRQWNQETSGNLENVRSGQTKTKPSSRARGCQRRRPNGRKIQPGTCRSRIDNFFPKNI